MTIQEELRIAADGARNDYERNLFNHAANSIIALETAALAVVRARDQGGIVTHDGVADKAISDLRHLTALVS